MKVWGVRDFYSRLEHISEEGSKFSLGYFALAVTSAVLATGGLLANSVAVIIGSMCVAPFLPPSRAFCIGWIYKKWKIVGKGLFKQLFGLLAGSAIAFLVAVTFSLFLSEVAVTPEIMARTLPTLKDVYLSVFIAISSGVAASLALVANPRIVSEPWQQLLDVMVGTEIAISLIPPASVMGIGLALSRFDVFLHSLALLVINVVSLDIVGSIPILYIAGIGPKPLQLERRIKEIAGNVIENNVETDEILTEVVFHDYEKVDICVNVHATEIHDFDRLLAKRISEEIKKKKPDFRVM